MALAFDASAPARHERRAEAQFVATLVQSSAVVTDERSATPPGIAEMMKQQANYLELMHRVSAAIEEASQSAEHP